MDLSTTIIPKSDQLNADDLISGPRTIKITDVRSGSAEQPVNIHYEGDNGRPYKPGKSMRRVLVAIWGKNPDVYAGRRLTLYRDPNVKFGGEETGGIRISHASHITERHTMALTVTRGKRKPYTVEPLADEPAQPKFVPPEGWKDWTNEERGLNRANAGVDAFRAWWKTLSKAEAETLKTKLDEWKSIAEAADQAKK
jgi:hypothetical protein